MTDYLVENPHEIRFGNGDELLAYISSTLISREKQYGFRGHASASWKLESTLWRFIWEIRETFRSQRKRDLKCLYDTVVEDLQFYFEENIIVNGDVSRDELKEMDIWQFGQHYGLPTPLLDWTQSPYAALFFALDGRSVPSSKIMEENMAEDTNERCLWVMDTFIMDFVNDAVVNEVRKKNESSFGSTDMLKEHYPTLELKREVNAKNKRIRYQQGFLTHHGNLSSVEVWINRVGKEMYHPRMETPFLQKLIFPCPEKSRIDLLDKMDHMNINSRTLFPDIQGSVIDAKDRTFRNFIKAGKTKSFSSKAR